MRILGIETSCDETAAAVVENGRTVLSNIVNSQIDLHSQFGGVVPEIAARSHVEVINPIINRALKEAELSWNNIDAIAVANGPGLIGSLLVGTLAARTLAITQNKPLYSVHHIMGHFFSNFLDKTQPDFPCLALIISGGHTQLMHFTSPNKFSIIGKTQDDAVGEAFDKVAKIIGLPYPGGPSISQAAKNGNAQRFIFTKPKLQGEYDFSFSGVKTAVLRTAQEVVGKDYRLPSHQIAPLLSPQDRNDLAASFQSTAIDILLDKTQAAFAAFKPKSVCLGGGVSANQLLRQRFKTTFGDKLTYPKPEYCTDNAAMIAAAGFFATQSGQPPADPYSLEVQPQHSLA